MKTYSAIQPGLGQGFLDQPFFWLMMPDLAFTSLSEYGLGLNQDVGTSGQGPGHFQPFVIINASYNSIPVWLIYETSINKATGES